MTVHLVDTSVWVDFLRGISNPRVSLLESLLHDGEAYLCEVTYAEICVGAKSPQQFQKFAQSFAGLPFLSLPNHWHQEIARMGYVLKSKGRKAFIADLLIALVALHHRVPLLSKDKDFEVFRALFGLRLE